MPPLALTLCGPVTLLDADGGDHGAGLGAKALGLLAYLALEPRSHPRDVVTALLWGEYPEERARASLRQALSQLRHVFAGRLDADRASVALDPAAVVTDVDALRRAGDPAAGAAAMRADVARFLAELPVRHCDAFDEWAATTRASLARAAARALADAAGDAMARADWRTALAAADRWRVLAPLDDAAARAAVEARFLSGDGPGARALLAEHAARTREAAGREPDRALRALGERMERETRAAARTTPARVDTPIGGVAAAQLVPLCGRDAEWRALRDAWGRLTIGAGHVVVLEGELGAGKTRLAGDFARWCAARRGSVLRARAREAQRDVPYAAFAQLVRGALDAPDVAAVDGTWLSELSRVVPEVCVRLPGVPEPSTAAADASRLHEAATHLLLALAAERPQLVVVDDAEWLDAESAALVRVLVESSADAPVLWVLALTDGRARRDAPGGRLARAARALPHAATARLARLGRADVRALVADALGRDDEEAHALADRVLDDTAGTPGWVALHLDALRAWRGRPEAGGGRVALPAFGVAAHPAVRAPIFERAKALGEDERAVLTTLALADAPCDADILSHVHGMSRLRAATVGSALVEAGLAAEDAGAFACTHPVVARVVRDAPGTALQREVHRALAYTLAAPERLARLGGAGLAAHHGRVAHHAAAGGEPAMAFHHAAAAVEAALCAGDAGSTALDAAIAWAGTALAHAASPDEAQRAEALGRAAAARPEPAHRTRLAASTRDAAPQRDRAALD